MATREYERLAEQEQWPIGWTYSPTSNRLSRNKKARSPRKGRATSPSNQEGVDRLTQRTSPTDHLREQNEERLRIQGEREYLRREAARRAALRMAEEAAERPLPTKSPPPGWSNPGREKEKEVKKTYTALTSSHTNALSYTLLSLPFPSLHTGV